MRLSRWMIPGGNLCVCPAHWGLCWAGPVWGTGRKRVFIVAMVPGHPQQEVEEVTEMTGPADTDAPGSD